MGIPVIATDTNVIPEVVRHGQSGIVVPAGDPEKMASAMQQMLTSKEKALMLGKCGRRIVEKDYSLASFAEKTLDAYRSFRGYE